MSGKSGRAGAAVRPPVGGTGFDPRRHEAAADERSREPQAKTLRRPGGPARSGRSRRGLQVEEAILKLLQSSPGMGTAAIARATAAERSTTVERLKRLQAKGRIERDDAGVGWRAPA